MLRSMDYAQINQMLISTHGRHGARHVGASAVDGNGALQLSNLACEQW